MILGKILIKKTVEVYEENGESITETKNKLIKDGVILLDQFGPISLADALMELGIEFETEYTYEKN
jgi:hypothetical protein